MSFSNVYADPERAQSYATLEFPGTYYLAFRDLPAIIAENVAGVEALDFGCGAGRSTRFLKQLGFNTVGIDISANMIDMAKKADPGGTYLLVDGDGPGDFDSDRFDVILSAFAFDNIPNATNRIELLSGLCRLLRENGRIILLGSTPEIYVHEWASFTTRDFPQNRRARSGDLVRTVMKDVPDARPVDDILWFHEDYLHLFAESGLELIGQHRPLGYEDEPYAWVAETSIAPWVIYVLGKPGNLQISS